MIKQAGENLPAFYLKLSLQTHTRINEKSQRRYDLHFLALPFWMGKRKTLAVNFANLRRFLNQIRENPCDLRQKNYSCNSIPLETGKTIFLCRFALKISMAPRNDIIIKGEMCVFC